jgi:acetyl esterase/lipase
MGLTDQELQHPGHAAYRANAVHLYRDVDYDTKQPHTKLDVYCPPETVKPKDGRSVIMWVHGGAWHLGDKEHSRFPAEHLARDGHVVVVPAYHLSGLSQTEVTSILQFGLLFAMMLGLCLQSTVNRMMLMIFAVCMVSVFLIALSYSPENKIQHPQHVRDVALALRWTKDNIADFGGDPRKIVVMGHSAGAHLATLLASNTRFLDEVGLQPDVIKGVVSISGVYNDKRMQESRLGNALMSRVFGSESMFDCFPIYNVQTHVTPPHFLINAQKDITLKRHTLDMWATLRAKEVYAQVLEVPDTTHWTICSEWDGQRADLRKAINDFVSQCLDYASRKKLFDDGAEIIYRNASLQFRQDKGEQVKATG